MWKVYEIRTTKDQKVYFGCTSTPIDQRMAVHRYQKKLFVLQSHSITIVLETESYDEAASLEASLIKHHDSTNPERGYNRRLGDSRHGFPKYVKQAWSEKVKEERTFAGPNNPNFGKQHSDETKEKIRKKALARDYSKIQKWTKTEEQKAVLSSLKKEFYKTHTHHMLGGTHSEEARKKISESANGNQRWLGRKHSPETILKQKLAQKAWRDKKKLQKSSV